MNTVYKLKEFFQLVCFMIAAGILILLFLFLMQSPKDQGRQHGEFMNGYYETRK